MTKNIIYCYSVKVYQTWIIVIRYYCGYKYPYNTVAKAT